jgi:large subunit ribosomal protein L15
MKLHDLRPAEGSHKARTRVGRGIAAGKGKTAGRGTKGQKARAGGSIPPWFEGGQTPLHMRIPKLRGFRNPFKVEYEVVNLGRIAALVELGALEAGEPAETPKAKGGKAAATAAPITVNQEILRAVGLVRTLDKPMKVLGQGEIDRALFVVADAFSKSAVAKIEAAGGSVQVLQIPTSRLPAPKPLAVYVGADLPDGVGRLVESTEAVRRVERQEDADLAFTLAGRLRATTRAAVVVVDDDRPTETYLPELIVAENEPLVDGLSWQGLLVRDTRALGLRPTDRALLWHGKRPLVFLRDAEGAQQLWINFDPRHANALRLPAFAVLLGRYVEAVRAARLTPEVRNVETWERLAAAVDAAGPPLIVRHGGGEERLEAAQAALLHAPGRPGPFEVRQGERLVLGGAAHFADMREADLRHAASFDGLGAAVRAEAVRNSRPDPLAPLWMVVLGGLLLANWKLTG